MQHTTQTAQPTAWPEAIIARYLTVGGATVDIETLTIDIGDPYSTRSTCGGCGDWDENQYDGYRNYRDEAARERASQDDTRAWAQAHAEKCRAMPRPEATHV